ncbi:DUF4124 domain-containing protein [Lentisalinibacter sediminis]|uniref:DUF4124 domain-containing protein n=1 Tax=Lentisalinibacter sediminis TaxID=2992237 RepID=UPI00386BEAA1
MFRIHLIPALLLAAGLAHAGQIYHWVDEDGVAHYSQTPPAEAAVPVETREITTSTPDDYDPDDYEYSVMNQAARIHAEWAALAEERAKEQEARREARRAAQEHLAHESYERREDRYGWRYGREVYYPVVHPRPPHRPGHKVRRHQSRQLGELGLWREPPAYSINSTRHWQRVQQTRSLALP